MVIAPIPLIGAVDKPSASVTDWEGYDVDHGRMLVKRDSSLHMWGQAPESITMCADVFCEEGDVDVESMTAARRQ